MTLLVSQVKYWAHPSAGVAGLRRLRRFSIITFVPAAATLDLLAGLFVRHKAVGDGMADRPIDTFEALLIRSDGFREETQVTTFLREPCVRKVIIEPIRSPAAVQLEFSILKGISGKQMQVEKCAVQKPLDGIGGLI